MLLVTALALALSSPCPAVEKARAGGMSDQQIEDAARSRGVPENVIRWAKTHCKHA